MSLKDWSIVPGDNAAKPGINWPEGMPPRDVNDSARQMMADLAVLPGTKGADSVGFSHAETAAQGSIADRLKRTIHVTDAPFNAKPDGSAAAAAFIAARTAAAGGTIHVPKGTFKLNMALTSAEDLVIEGDGYGTVLDFTGAVGGGNYALEAIGAVTQIQALSGTQNAGATSVLFASAPSLSAGDTFVIFNPTDSSYSGFRVDYRDGEWCEVDSVVGNNVTLKSPLYNSYAAASVNIYKVTASPRVHIRNLTIVGDSVLGLIKLTYCTNFSIENVKFVHANDSAIYIDRCCRGLIFNPVIENYGDGGDDYGIAYGNSQHIRTIGGNIYARRHAVTHGGNSGICTVPCRDIQTIGAVLKNDPGSGIQTADFHGNSEDCHFVGCSIYGGVSMGGKDVSILNSLITSDNGGRCVYHSEVKGGALGSRNCRFVTYIDPDSSGRSVYDIGGNNLALTDNTVEDATFYVTDSSVFGRNLGVSTIFCRVGNNGCVKKLNFQIEGLRANVNLFGAVLRTGLSTGTADSDFIIVDRISGFPTGTALHTAVGSAYLNFPHRLQRQSGTETLSAAVGTASTVGTLKSFKYPYPRPPHATVGGQTAFNGNVAALPILTTVSATQIRPSVLSATAVNWTATLAVPVNWQAVIDEV